jgi:hypothetical protein
LQESIGKIAPKESQDITPMIGEMSAQIRDSIAGLGEVVKASKPKISMSSVTKSLKALQDSSETGSVASQESRAALGAKIDALISQQAKVAQILSEMAQPKVWDFDIQRDNLNGHIVSVTAKQVTNA